MNQPIRTATVKLNATVNGHLIEDAEIEVGYFVYPPEPEVGILTETVVVDYFRNAKTGRSMNGVLNALSAKDLADVENEIAESNV